MYHKFCWSTSLVRDHVERGEPLKSAKILSLPVWTDKFGNLFVLCLVHNSNGNCNPVSEKFPVYAAENVLELFQSIRSCDNDEISRIISSCVCSALLIASISYVGENKNKIRDLFKYLESGERRRRRRRGGDVENEANRGNLISLFITLWSFNGQIWHVDTYSCCNLLKRLCIFSTVILM
jgi:hypothetical protein